jgi:prevent-host-death family protein
MTMKIVSVSDAKATLSEQIRHVKRGEEVILTERGRPVARLVPIDHPALSPGMDELISAGLVRVGTGALPRRFWALPRPADRGASVRKAASEDRETGW